MPRPAPVWTPTSPNKDLGEFARKAADAHGECEADKAKIAEFVQKVKEGLKQ